MSWVMGWSLGCVLGLVSGLKGQVGRAPCRQLGDHADGKFRPLALELAENAFVIGHHAFQRGDGPCRCLWVTPGLGQGRQCTGMGIDQVGVMQLRRWRGVVAQRQIENHADHAVTHPKERRGSVGFWQ